MKCAYALATPYGVSGLGGVSSVCGVSRSVEELVTCAFDAVSLDWRDHVRSDPSLYRGSAELHDLVGDASKARRVLGWAPEVRLDELMRMMVEADRARLQDAENAAS